MLPMIGLMSAAALALACATYKCGWHSGRLATLEEYIAQVNDMQEELESLRATLVTLERVRSFEDDEL